MGGLVQGVPCRTWSCLFSVDPLDCVVSICDTRIVRPYSWVRDVFRVSCVLVTSSWNNALELATRYTFRLYFELLCSCLVCVCGNVPIFCHIRLVHCGRGMVCVFSLGVWITLSCGWYPYGYGQCRWFVLVRLWVCRTEIQVLRWLCMSMLCWWAVPMRISSLMGPLSIRFWLWEVDCRGCSDWIDMYGSINLVRHKVCLVLAILRIGEVVYPQCSLPS